MKPLFSEREVRAVAIFLPLAALVILGIALLRPKADPAAARIVESEMELRCDTLRPAPFDPNTADFGELRALGLSKSEAASLLRYRAAGKVFRIPEDVALCYGIGDSLYRALAPYIRIGRQFAIAPHQYRTERVIARPLEPSPFRIDTVTVNYLRAIGALSRRQAEVFIRWRDMHGIYDMEDLRECYMISDSLAEALEPYAIFPERKARMTEFPVELNGADSATLRGIAGIGEKSVVRIIDYRRQLGGFVRPEQLAEIPGITESNYEKISRQIYCDSCRIRKIDINFASSNELARHPYIAPQTLRKLLKKRQLKGGWSNARELFDDDIFKPEEAARLAPYLQFGATAGPDDRPDSDEGMRDRDVSAPQPNN